MGCTVMRSVRLDLIFAVLGGGLLVYRTVRTLQLLLEFVDVKFYFCGVFDPTCICRLCNELVGGSSN